MFKRSVSRITLILLSICMLTSIFGPTAVRMEPAKAESLAGTLIDRIRFYLNSSLINWTNNYFGLLFDKQNITDMENYVDNLAAQQDWIGVLQWSVRLKKLGVERELSIKCALGNLTKAGELPDTNRGAFCVYCRDVLYACYYYANHFNYLTDKWNVTMTYRFFKDAIESNSTNNSALLIYSNGSVAGYNRFYDEHAETLQAYLTFYDLGVSEALSDAENVWNYINNNHWDGARSFYVYKPDSTTWECESPFFSKIAALLRWYDPDVGNFGRLAEDAYVRFLQNRWMSKQWTEKDASSDSAYVVLHAHPGNVQRRLQNTLGAWFTMLGMYNASNSTERNDLKALLEGYDNFSSAWALLYHPNAQLYDNSSEMFKTESTAAIATSYATTMALTLQSLMGIVPISTTIAFPLEEYYYEYNYDIDPDLFKVDVLRNTIQVAVTNRGTMEFIYGDMPVICNFPKNGVYRIAFSNDWNNIVNLSRLGDLPTNRKFLQWIEPRNWTVDDDGSADFRTIQEAINAANPGDTIYVRNGTYCENLFLNETLSLFGESRENTTIDGGRVGTVINLTANDVVISGFTVRNSGINSSDSGIYASNSSNTIIQNSNIESNYNGIWLQDSTSNNISDNDIGNNYNGLWLWRSPSNSISKNNLTENQLGIRLNESSGNLICHNNFVSNVKQVSTEDSSNVWDNGYPSGGNYWNEHNGLDELSDFYQNETSSDGIGDASYEIDGTNRDRYPLMTQYPCIHAIAIRDLRLDKTVVGQGLTTRIDVDVINQGHFIETLNLTIYANTTIIGVLANVNLENEDCMTITFVWNTTGFNKDNYTIKTVANTVPSETYTADNNFTDGGITVAMTGDLTGGTADPWDFVPDGVVDGSDLIVVSRCFGSYSGAPPPMKWHPNCNITNNEVIDESDLIIVSRHFGEKDS